MKNFTCTVVVCSCDKYADILPPFSALWKKYWPDCPFETVPVTESAPASPLCFARIIACGKGGNWCSRLVMALGQITTPYVLMLCDDYYLEKPVDTALILKRLMREAYRLLVKEGAMPEHTEWIFIARFAMRDKNTADVMAEMRKMALKGRDA